jgi:hypothetical protein
LKDKGHAMAQYCEKAMAFFGLWLKLFSFYVKPFSCDKNFQSKSQREQQDLRDTSGLKSPTRKIRNKKGTNEPYVHILT